jgi:glycosyltransferase involved in cell wall biosynthesis
MDRILISSPSFSSFFTQEMSIPKSRIFYLPQPVEIPPHNETSKFYSEKYSFVYAGNIGKLQQIDKIVEACVPFANDRSFSFHILGKGSEVSRVKFLIKKLGLEHSVFYDGYISSNQIGSYLSSATVLVVSLKNGHTVVSQTIPNKLSSYLAYKKPILGVIEGDGKALIDQIGAGITCGDQVGAISNAISSFMKTSEEEMKCIGLRNYEYFCKHFAFETLMNELSEHLKAMVEKNDAKKGAKDQKL